MGMSALFFARCHRSRYPRRRFACASGAWPASISLADLSFSRFGGFIPMVGKLQKLFALRPHGHLPGWLPALLCVLSVV